MNTSVKYHLSAVCAVFAVCAIIWSSSALANPLANDSTVLNYLIEMERQAGKGCNNEPVKLPALLPKAELQELADILGTTETPLGDLLATRDMNRTAVHSAFVYASSPKEAVQKLRAANCAELLSPLYTQIGSNRSNNKWTIVLASDQWETPATAPDNIAIVPGVHEVPAPSGVASASPAQAPVAQAASSAQEAQRPVYGTYPDGEPRVLPAPDEHRDPATPQVTGVYTDDTLAPVPNQQNQQSATLPAPAQPSGKAQSQAPLPQTAPATEPKAQPAPMQESSQPSASPADPRPVFGKYPGGEPIVLPEPDEQREAAQPQVTGVYDDTTLAPAKQNEQTSPAAPLVP